jgi:hypothetical protein
LLTDLLHWSRLTKHNFNQAVREAKDNFDHEIAEETQTGRAIEQSGLRTKLKEYLAANGIPYRVFAQTTGSAAPIGPNVG